MPGLPAEPIFISYSRRDDEVMRRVAFHLRDQGFKVWVDNEKLIPGTPAWEDAIEKAINSAFAVVVVLSPDSKNSEWVRREITYADQFNKRVFPVLVKGSEEESLPLRLVTRQFVDLRKDEGAGLKALVDAIIFYNEKKQTLEMKRPATQIGAVHLPYPTTSGASSTSASKPQKPFNWTLLLGVLSAFCILCAGASWIGYRAFSPIFASAPLEDFSTTPTDSAPISEPATAIPESTATQEASVPVTGSDILSEYLTDVEITHTDTFDNPSGVGWEFQNGEVKDGMLQIPTNPNYYGAGPTRSFKAGEGVVIDFVYPVNADFEMYYESGDYASSDYKRYGIFVGTDVIYVNARDGKNIIGHDFSGDLNLQPGTNYSVLIAILPNAEFLEVVWETDDASHQIVARETMDSSWSNTEMNFYVGAGQGSVTLDNYREIQFSGAK